MSLHNCQVTQANYDALAVPANLKKKNCQHAFIYRADAFYLVHEKIPLRYRSMIPLSLSVICNIIVCVNSLRFQKKRLRSKKKGSVKNELVAKKSQKRLTDIKESNKP